MYLTCFQFEGGPNFDFVGIRPNNNDLISFIGIKFHDEACLLIIWATKIEYPPSLSAFYVSLNFIQIKIGRLWRIQRWLRCLVNFTFGIGLSLIVQHVLTQK